MPTANMDAILEQHLAGTIPDLLDHFAERTPHKNAVHFLDSSGKTRTVCAATLRHQAWGIAHHLLEKGAPGDRILLLLPPGIEYIASFMGCLYAGMVAVPAYPLDTWNISSSLERLGVVVRDCAAQVALTDTAKGDGFTSHSAAGDLFTRLACVDVTTVSHADEPLRIPSPDQETLAFLQYTSGSTGNPRGVEITHRNLLENLAAMHLAFGHSDSSAVASWLPPYHDMGLIGGILLPIFGGLTAWHMSPTTFIRRPGLWLRTISEGKVTTTFAPNFALDHIVARLGPKDVEGLDLSCWRRAVNGAEPIRAASLERFAKLLEAAGFRREALTPGYGLAEGTLMVTCLPLDRDLRVVELDREALAEGRAVRTEERGGATMVGCGRPARATQVRIVDPDSCRQLPDGRIGEVWVTGPGVARGYWGHPEQSRKTFRACLVDGDEEHLRTGDLGFLLEGDLFLTGRCKDLIIHEGRNVYPSDMEELLENELPELRRGHGAVFGTMLDGREHVVVAYEPSRGRIDDPRRLLARVRAVLGAHARITPLAVLLVPLGASPRTTSGKIRRAGFRELFESLRLDVVAASVLAPETLGLDGAQELSLSAHPPETPLESLDIRFADIMFHAAAQPGIDVSEVLKNPSLATLGFRAEPADQETPGDCCTYAIRVILGELLGIPPDQVDENTPLRDLGVDSRQTVILCERLSERGGVRVSPELVFDHPTVAELARSLTALPADSSPEPSSPEPDGIDCTVVITGVACRVPGAETPREFERMLLEGRTGICLTGHGGVEGRPAGWIGALGTLDAKSFGISEREAATLDPQQALVLVACCQALEDAGHVWKEPPTRRMGVFVGVSSSDSALERQASGARPEIYEATGASHAIVANRISYLLDLTGPSLAVDTACSSSLTAFHIALQSIRRGECDAALVAGVNHMSSARVFEVLEDGEMLAPDGRPRAFSEGAAGYVRGEGVAALLLRRREDAHACGERVYATVRGSAVSHAGRTNGLTAPSSSSQVAVLRAALKDAETEPGEIAFVESHGTGTALGDPIELTALAEVYGRGREASSPLLIGAVKNNIGHLEAAAGLVGLVKAALVLESGAVPPVIGVDVPTRHFKWEGSGLVIPREPKTLVPRASCVAVSSFGFGGALGHAVLGPPGDAGPEGQMPRVLRLAATDGRELREMAARFADEVERSRGVDIPCPAAPGAREHVVVVASDPNRACEALRAVAHDEAHPDALSWRDAPGGGVLFLLPGQGSTSPGIAGQLRDRSASFAAALDRLCDELEARGVGAAKEFLTDPTADPLVFRRTEMQQPLLVALQLALAETLAAHGIFADLLLGHSVGEITAAALSGALSEAEALDLAVLRGKAMGKAPAGAMIACRAAASELEEILAAHSDWAVAAFNEPEVVVIAGPQRDVTPLLGAFARKRIPAQLLPVDHAFHTPAVTEAAEVLRDMSRDLAGRSPALAWFSSTTGALMTELGADHWVLHAIGPVRFGEAFAHIRDRKPAIALELGDSTLVGSARRVLSGSARVAPLLATEHGVEAFLRALATAEAGGVEVDWGTETHFSTRRPRRAFVGFTRTPEDLCPGPERAEQTTTTVPRSAQGLNREIILTELAGISGFPVERLGAQDRLHSDLGLDSLMISALARSLAAYGSSPQEQLMKNLVGDPTLEAVLSALSSTEPVAEKDVPWASVRPDTTKPLSSPEQFSENVSMRSTLVQACQESTRNVASWPEAREVADRFARVLNGTSNPYERVHEDFNGARITVRGRSMVNFASFDYLGFSHHPEVRRRAIEAVDLYGTSAAATPLLHGETPLHRDLESAIADLVGTEAALIFASGHSTNVGTISHLMGSEDLIVHDEWSHDSCVRGALMSGAVRRSFRHNDLDSLDVLLTRMRGSHRRALICAEGAYSQDGDLPDLPGLVTLAEKHDALLMIDEAHSIGVLGETGRGIGESQCVPGEAVNLWMGTLSKALGSLGGYIAGSRDMIDYLRYSAPLYLFSTGPSPANAAAALAAIEVLRREPKRVQDLHDRADAFRQLAREAGLNIGVSRESAVVPVIIGEWSRTVKISDELFRRGFNAMPIGYPAVPRDAARIRFFINAEHDERDLKSVVTCLADLACGSHPVMAHCSVDTQRAPRSPAVPRRTTIPQDRSSGVSLEEEKKKQGMAGEGVTAHVINPESALGHQLVEHLRAMEISVIEGRPGTEKPGLVFDCVGVDGPDPLGPGGFARGTRLVRVSWSDRTPSGFTGSDKCERGLRGEGDATVFAEARACGVHFTVLVARAVYGPGCRGTVVTAAALARAGLVNGEMVSAPAPLVCTANLAAAAAQAAGSEATYGRCLEIVDPHGLTWGRYLRDLAVLTNGMDEASHLLEEGSMTDPGVGLRAGIEAMDTFWTDRPWSYRRALAETAAWWWSRC